jgi:hypothetical protein
MAKEEDKHEVKKKYLDNQSKITHYLTANIFESGPIK